MIKKIDRADGPRYQVYVKHDGRKEYVGTYANRREAKDAEEDHRVTKRKIDRGELPPELDAKRTFGAAVKVWLKVLEDAGSPSFVDYDQRIANRVLPTFENVPIVEIRKNDVIAWRDDLGKHVTALTVNTILGTLSSAFTFFIGRDWITDNPVHGVKRLKPDPKVFPWLQSTDAITRLLAELPMKWRTLVAFLVGTGCRLDEALACRWDDVDLEHRLVTLRKTKAGKVRRVPIFDSVLPVLKEMKLARGGSPYLWPGGKAGTRLSQPSIRKPFKAACERAELSDELRLHDLRHTFASLFLVDGGDIFKLSRILGHHSVAITERTYAHLKPTAFEADYGRVRFHMPGEAKILAFTAAG